MVLRLISDDRARDRTGRIWVREGETWSKAAGQRAELDGPRSTSRPRLATVGSVRSSLQPGH